MNSRTLDLTGLKFEKFSVIRNVGQLGLPNDKYFYWECVCVCGELFTAQSSSIKRGRVNACKKCARGKDGKRRHGLSRHPMYICWREMKYRCTKERHHEYKNYGKRGISYDKSWEDFETFYRDMSPTWVRGLTLDRVNNDGNYCKENCRWTTQKEQIRNRRNTFRVEWEGNTLPLASLSEILGFDRLLVHQRITRQGWGLQKAIYTPVDRKRYKKKVVK